MRHCLAPVAFDSEGTSGERGMTSGTAIGTAGGIGRLSLPDNIWRIMLESLETD